MDLKEQQRLQEVQAVHILDTEAETIFDEAVLLASAICGTPVSLITILDEQRQWFKARIGIDFTETPREQAFCAHAIQQDGLFVVHDAHNDLRFRSNPLVTGSPHIRFYAGIPLVTTQAHALGTLCVIDAKPRELTQEQKTALTILGRQVATQIELRKKVDVLHQTLVEKGFLENEISSSNALFHAFLDNCPMVGYVKEEDGRMVYYNRPFAEQFQITRQEWLGKDDFEIWPPEFAAGFRAEDVTALAAGKLLVVEESSPGPDGKTLHWRSYKFPFVNDAGKRYLAGMSLDITSEKDAEEQLKLSHDQLHLANERLRELSVTDSLTGLCNRRGFDERIRQEFTMATRFGYNFSVILVDVDHFKSLNDTFGHESGDEVLRQIAQVLGRCGRASDLICRHGGEEFAFLLPHTNLKQAVLLADRARRLIEEAAWDRRKITISGGVSSNVQGIGDPQSMVHMADLALYEAKALGRNRIVAYEPALERAAHAHAV